jgi:hypothetical protein
MYIDPNTGGVLFQILAVAFVSLSGVILIFSGRIRRLFSKLRRSMRRRGEPVAEMPDSGAPVKDESITDNVLPPPKA